MCKIKHLRYQCGHKYVHRPSPCARAEPGEAYDCRRNVYLPFIQIKTYCAPCSKRQYSRQFFNEYQELLHSDADNQAVLRKYQDYEYACDLLNQMCSRDQPFWEHMSREDYLAAGGRLESDSYNEAPSEKERRKETEILRYRLRRTQSTFPKPPEVKGDSKLVEKPASTDADHLQRLFAKASLKTETVEEAMDNLTLQGVDCVAEPLKEVLAASEGSCCLRATTPPSSKATISKWSSPPRLERQSQHQRCDIPVASHYGM